MRGHLACVPDMKELKGYYPFCPKETAALVTTQGPQGYPLTLAWTTPAHGCPLPSVWFSPSAWEIGDSTITILQVGKLRL